MKIRRHTSRLLIIHFVVWHSFTTSSGADDSYVDDRSDYVKNEVGLNYNGGLFCV